ncbi:ABC transporter ATP-binding protein, partial [Symbiobacterium thermophilum]|uniref:ABC transporter ATP-binding protein n=1 Tax=Symbiobacterium thermophilum TaxID=2734 RepID=UPI0035C73213
RLLLRMGRSALAVGLADVESARMAGHGLRVPGEAGVMYAPRTDTLFMVADHRQLVSVDLSRPYAMKVPGQGICQFTRIVLSLDEPERFLQAVAGRRGQVHLDRPQPAAGGEGRPGATSPAPPVVSEGPAPGGAALALEGLVKRFGGFTAVAGVDLAVRYGEIVAFLGSNGAGKSTTIRMATGLVRPSAGRVLVEGRDLWAEGAPVRRLLGYVPDTPLLYESLTAREFLWLMAGLYGLSRVEGRRRADELLRQVGMERWADYPIRAFSLGMKRKMAIAAALVHRPRVLLLDEVTNGLDPRAAREVKDFIRQAAGEGAAVLLTTHALDVARELADRIAILHGGRLRAVGDLEALRSAAGLPGAGLEELFLALTAEAEGVSA